LWRVKGDHGQGGLPRHAEGVMGAPSAYSLKALCSLNLIIYYLNVQGVIGIVAQDSITKKAGVRAHLFGMAAVSMILAMASAQVGDILF